MNEHMPLPAAYPELPMDPSRITRGQLIRFFRSIPDEDWCADVRDDLKGRHCALGLIDRYYQDKNPVIVKGVGVEPRSLPSWLDAWKLIMMNNCGYTDSQQIPEPMTYEQASRVPAEIKQRVIAWLEGLDES